MEIERKIKKPKTISFVVWLIQVRISLVRFFIHHSSSIPRDFSVADEGHILKNSQTALAKCLSKIKTRRRIVLTGTPLQNNLIE